MKNLGSFEHLLTFSKQGKSHFFHFLKKHKRHIGGCAGCATIVIIGLIILIINLATGVYNTLGGVSGIQDTITKSNISNILNQEQVIALQEWLTLLQPFIQLFQ